MYLCFSSQPHPLDELLALVLTTGPTLIYGSKKMLVHGIGHTLVNRVGSRAKLDEGSTRKVSTCDGVHLQNFQVHEVDEVLEGVIVGHYRGTFVTSLL